MLPLLIGIGDGVVLAKGSRSQFGGEVNSKATLLKITSTAAKEGMWLGVTFYPPRQKDAVKDGVSQAVPLKKGYNYTDIAIPAYCRNGTFEAAIWGKKLSKKEIAPSDVASQKLGYKLTEMVYYLWGYLIEQ